VRIGKRYRYPTTAVIAYLEGLGVEVADATRAILGGGPGRGAGV
jgi:hypothetical protein